MKIHRGVKLQFDTVREDTLAGDAMGRLRDGDDIDKANRWDHILKHQFQNGYEIEISAEEAKDFENTLKSMWFDQSYTDVSKDDIMAMIKYFDETTYWLR